MKNYKYKNHPGFEPFTSLIDDLFKTNIGDILGGDIANNTPSVNTKETDDSFILEIAAPGVQKGNFHIEIEKGHLVVSAKPKSATSDAEESDFKRREFDYSQFRRSFRLKENIDTDQIKAKYDLGVLTIYLPKLGLKETENSKIIEVE